MRSLEERAVTSVMTESKLVAILKEACELIEKTVNKLLNTLQDFEYEVLQKGSQVMIRLRLGTDKRELVEEFLRTLEQQCREKGWTIKKTLLRYVHYAKARYILLTELCRKQEEDRPYVREIY